MQTDANFNDEEQCVLGAMIFQFIHYRPETHRTQYISTNFILSSSIFVLPILEFVLDNFVVVVFLSRAKSEGGYKVCFTYNENKT